MQITTATRTVEIYANTADYVTYRNVKDGAAYGPMRTAKADAKAGTVGREVFDAAQVPATPVAAAEVEVAATPVATCQYPTEMDPYGLPVATCGAPAVEHRPDRLFVRNVCADHGGVQTAPVQLSGRGVGLPPAPFEPKRLKAAQGPATDYSEGERRARERRIRKAINLEW